MKRNNSAGAVRNSSKKLHPNDILRKFASGMTVVSDCIRTLRTKMTSITLPFDSRKSRKLKRISQWSVTDAHTAYGVGCSCCFVDSGCARTYVSKQRRVCSRFSFSIRQSKTLRYEPIRKPGQVTGIKNIEESTKKVRDFVGALANILYFCLWIQWNNNSPSSNFLNILCILAGGTFAKIQKMFCKIIS